MSFIAFISCLIAIGLLFSMFESFIASIITLGINIVISYLIITSLGFEVNMNSYNLSSNLTVLSGAFFSILLFFFFFVSRERPPHRYAIVQLSENNYQVIDVLPAHSSTSTITSYSESGGEKEISSTSSTVTYAVNSAYDIWSTNHRLNGTHIYSWDGFLPYEPKVGEQLKNIKGFFHIKSG